ncbi:MAG: prepilin-type N-terminal cleavage/methylation domain-containing protein [Phycisphaerales bacterium]
MAPSCPQHSTRSTGFSLVELVVVMLILGVIAAIAAPRFGHASTTFRLEAAINKIEADLKYAAQMARAQSRTVKVTFDPDTDSYTITGVDGPLDGVANYTVNLAEPPYEVQIADVRFTLGTSSTFRIDGHGAPINTGVIRIELGPNARLIGVEWSIPSDAKVKAEPIEPSEDVFDIETIIPDGFIKGF